MIEFEESGLKFIFPDGNCYRIENDPLVTHGYCGSTNNNMACECVSVIDGRHCFIEVKRSVPKGPNASKEDLSLNGSRLPKNWETYDNFQSFLRAIAKKFSDSFYILKSLQDCRHGKERKQAVNLPCALNPDNIRFVLIINFPKDSIRYLDRQSLVNLQDALKAEMRPFLNLWSIKDAAVKVLLPKDAAAILNIPVKGEDSY